MTKLMEWLFVGGTFFGIWTAVITGTVIQSNFIDGWRHLILPLPVILLILFGLYATIVVLYRVFTFNDCEAAAKELQSQIEEARADLRMKGVLG